MKNKKIGFIYLDELHHIHHFLSPAIELSKKGGYDVEILTYESKHEYLVEMLHKLGGEKIKITRLNTYWYRKIIETLKKRSQPSALYIYQKHIKRLLKYDALIFTDHTANIIYNARNKQKTPKLIHLAHGSGDGSYGYQDTHKIYDLIIAAGNKKTNRLLKEQSKANLNIKICGYSKFDLINLNNTNPLKFNNNNPIILYTPHFKEGLSSWYLWGEEILDYFLHNTNYNLIFAPHINLFNKKGFERPNLIDRKHYNAPNIHIDLGSINSIDMTYTSVSHIYLGDVSSQVYEFMINTRPLIFLNAHNIKWKENKSYLFWSAGKVISSVDDLEPTLKTAKIWKKQFEAIQRSLFNDTFNLTKERSGMRVALAIIKEVN